MLSTKSALSLGHFRRFLPARWFQDAMILPTPVPIYCHEFGMSLVFEIVLHEGNFACTISVNYEGSTSGTSILQTSKQSFFQNWHSKWITFAYVLFLQIDHKLLESHDCAFVAKSCYPAGTQRCVCDESNGSLNMYWGLDEALRMPRRLK